MAQWIKALVSRPDPESDSQDSYCGMKEEILEFCPVIFAQTHEHA